MKKSLLAVLALLLPGLAISAYTPQISYELTKKNYDVKSDGTYTLVSEEIVKIETETGAKEESTVDIPFNKTDQRVQILKAYTIQTDGKKITVPKSGIRVTEDQLAEGAPIFDDIKHEMIIFPDVKVGSRLYCKYKLIEHNPQFKGQFFAPIFFSPHYTVGLYETKINISDKLKLNLDLKDVKGGLVGHSKGVDHYVFTFKLPEVHKPEEGQLDFVDFAPYEVISTFNNQEEMGIAYQKGLTTKTKVTPEVQKLANQITHGITDEKEQIHAIYNWVTRKIRYVAVYVGNGGVVPHEANAIISNRYGDCKDHAVLLEALLRAKGIESSAALINLGNAYSLPKYGVLNPQNHVINYVPKYDLYLDSTSEITRFGNLPYEDLDKPTLLTALGKIGHTPLMTPVDFYIATTVKMSVDEKGYISGETITHTKGSAEDFYREKMIRSREMDDKDVVDKILSAFGETGEGHFKSTDPYDIDKPFVLEATFKLDPVANMPGPAAMTVPVGVASGSIFLAAKDKPNFIHDYPFACYPAESMESYEIKFPDKVKVTRIPESKDYVKDNVIYHSSYKLEDNAVKVDRHLIVNHETIACRPDQQDFSEEFFSFLQADLRSQIFYE
jgi:Domain of Unknown Function with PDB structure (DUF3857)/Transglutaminase-like superfamily